MKIIIAANKKCLVQFPESDKSLLESTYDMFIEEYGKENIVVQCTNDIKDKVQTLLNNAVIFTEPIEKGTAAAIGLACVRLFLENPDESVAVAYSDHPVSFKDKLISTFSVAEKIQKSTDRLILVAVNPTYPETKYGYAKIGKVLESMNGIILFEMVDFKEKPEANEAEDFLSSWRYLWNTGYMITTPRHLLNLYKEVLPDLYKALMTIKESIGTEMEAEIINTIFKKLKKVSIDKGVYEKISNENVGIIPVDLQIQSFKDY